MAPFSNLINILFSLGALVLTSTLLPWQVDAKTSSGSIQLTGEKSEFLLTKFATSPNSRGKFNLALTILRSDGVYADERSLKIHYFVDEAWYKGARNAPTCAEKMRHAIRSNSVMFSQNREGDKWLSRSYDTLDSMHSDKIQYWYITLDDCSLEESYHSPKDTPKIYFEWTAQDALKNNDGRYVLSHFSADQRGMVQLHFVQITVSTLLLVWCLYKIGRAMISTKQIHIAFLAVMIALCCDIASCLSELIHDGIYSSNGIGSYTFDAFAAHFEAMCDAMMAIVLLLVGSGWTLPSDVIVADAKNNMAMLGTNNVIQKLVSGLGNPLQEVASGNPAPILIASTFVLHSLLAQWGRTYDDDFDCYHSLEHLPGTVLMLYRVVLGIAFLAGVASVRNSGRCPQALKPFLTKFMLVGVSWFLSLPFIATFVSTCIPYHLKHRVLFAGAAVTQMCSLTSLVWLFTADSDASAYHRISKVQDIDESMTLGSTATSKFDVVSKSPSKFWKFGKTKIRLD